MSHPAINFHGKIISLLAPQLTRTTLVTIYIQSSVKLQHLISLNFYEVYDTDELHVYSGWAFLVAKTGSGAQLCSHSTRKQLSILNGIPQGSNDDMYNVGYEYKL
jgi:hypothetical protein